MLGNGRVGRHRVRLLRTGEARVGARGIGVMPELETEGSSEEHFQRGVDAHAKSYGERTAWSLEREI